MKALLPYEEAMKIVRAICNDENPRVQADAIRKRDQWLLELELGTLEMHEETKAALEAA